MLYLAQVTRTKSLGNAGLRLLACQKSETTWAIESGEEIVLCVEADSVSEDSLVLVDLCENGEVKSLCHALEWVLYLVQQYLTNGITPELLQAEAERDERWRQELTKRSQDIGQASLQVQARQEQIQQLEADLNRDRQELERDRQELEARCERIRQLEANLNGDRQELEALRQSIWQLEENLKRAKQEFEREQQEFEKKKLS